MQNRKVVVAVVVNILVAISSFQLLGLLNLPQKQLDMTSKIRFLCFIGIHAMVFITMIIIIRLQGCYNYILLTFINCLIIAVAISITEVMVRQIQMSPYYNYKKKSGANQSLELTYLNLYFLTYMYSIIGFIITGIYIAATEVLINKEEDKINQGANRCLKCIVWSQDIAEIQCSICLQFMNGINSKYVEIRMCGHLYHRRCLVQWMMRNSTCPLCRVNIFLWEEGESL